MTGHLISIRLTQQESKTVEQLSRDTGQNKSQIIRDLIQHSQPAQVIDRSREILPHLCSILSAVAELDTQEADTVRKEVNDLCQLLSK